MEIRVTDVPAIPLKPCPFCGGKAALDYMIVDGEASLFWIACQDENCSISGPDETSQQQAITAWNTRHD